MCGIAAIYSYQNKDIKINSQELVRVRDYMVSRGPDGSGLWIDKDQVIGLAHRRLAILDLSSAGAQPMHSLSGLYSIVFNGEIYNFKQLRETLAEKGYIFFSGTDTEVLINAYQEYGQDMVLHLQGMFAFAIWDHKKNGLFLARDHFGIKPLYYHDNGYIVRVASQVKSLVHGGGIYTQLEPAGQVGFLLWGFVPDPYTSYRGIFSLPAGHTLWVDQKGPSKANKYFDIAEEISTAESTQFNNDIEGVISEALEHSVKQHLIADVPVGVFLSAGLDSSALLAIGAQKDKSLSAVTLGFDVFKRTAVDEVPLAKKIAEHFRCSHNYSYIDQRDFNEELPKILHAMDQPSIDGINTYLVSRAAKNAGLKVCLSGVGGDELFGGYPSFEQIPKLTARMEVFSKVPMFGKCLRFISSSILRRMMLPKYAGIFEYGDSYSGAYLLRRGLFMPWELPSLLDADIVKEGWEKLQPLIRMNDLIRPLSGSHAKITTLELSMYMRNMLLRDADWAGMAHSLEIRTPMVDIGLFRAIAPLLSQKGDYLNKKHLAGVLKRYLPQEVLDRPKSGFAIPVSSWLGGDENIKNSNGLRVWALKIQTNGGS